MQTSIMGYTGEAWGSLLPVSGCANTFRQQSPITIPNEIKPYDGDPLWMVVGSGFELDTLVNPETQQVAGFEENAFYRLPSSFIEEKRSALRIGDEVFLLQDVHHHLGGPEHVLPHAPDVDATTHLVHSSGSGLVVLEVQLKFDEAAEIDLGIECSAICQVCGASSDGAHVCTRHQASLDGNICDLKQGQVATSVSGARKSFPNWQNWLGIDLDLKGYYVYSGGLTTPPCDGNLRFIVRPEPLHVKPPPGCDEVQNLFSNDQIGTGNVRSVQPLLDDTPVYQV